MKQTVLIFGISSFVGTNIAMVFKDEFRVVGTYYSNPVEIPGILCLPCDVLKKDYVSRIVGLVKPDFVIYAVGLSSLNECKQYPKLADALNSAGAINCMSAAERNAARMIYLSSGFVMEGRNELFHESDSPFPETEYGSSLASTEFYIQRSSLNYFILRCPVLYGRSIQTEHENFFEYMQRQFSRGEIYPADGSVITGFLDVTIMAEILKICIKMNLTNRLLQVSSADFMSRYDFAIKYAQIFKKEGSIASRADIRFPFDDKGTKEISGGLHFKMDSSNLETELNIKMPTIEDSLRVTYLRLNNLA